MHAQVKLQAKKGREKATVYGCFVPEDIVVYRKRDFGNLAKWIRRFVGKGFLLGVKGK